MAGELVKGVKLLGLFEKALLSLKMRHTFRGKTVNEPSPKKGIRKSGMNVTRATSIACSSQWGATQKNFRNPVSFL
jgi:hypothetical protein